MISKRSYPTILLVAGFVFFFIYMLSYPRPASIDLLYGFSTTNDNLNLLFARCYGESGSFQYPLPYHGFFSRDIELALTPRDATQFGGYLVPKFFLGALLFWGTIVSIDGNILLVTTPLMGTLIGVLLYLITRRVFDEKIAIITSIVAFFFPILWFWAGEILNMYLTSIPLFLMGFLYFIKLLETKECKYYFLSALFLAISISYRFENCLLVLPFLFYAIFMDRDVAVNKRMLISIITIAFVLMPIPLLNSELYGNFLITGYHSEANLVSGVTNIPGASFFLDLNLHLIPKYVETYIIKFAPLLTLGFVLGLLIAFKGKGKIKYYGCYSLYVLIITTIFYGSDVTYGFYRYVMTAGFAHHILLAYLLMIPLFIVTVKEIKEKKVRVLLVSIFIIICIINVFTAPSAIIDRFNEIQENRDFHDLIIEKTEPNSIIIQRYYDKFLFPDRSTIYSILLAPPPPNSINLEDYRLPDIKPDPYVLGHKAAYIANQGIPVYVTEVDYDNLHDFKQVLLQEGYTVEALGMKPHKEVYKIVRLDENRRYVFPFVLK